MFDKEEWKNRYAKNACTLEHLKRLCTIGRLTQEDIERFEEYKQDCVKGDDDV